MKIINFIIFFCVAILPSIIQAEAINELKDILEDMASKKKYIRGIFKPSVGGFLGIGSTSITYRGLLGPIKKEVAMKFTSSDDNEDVANEYKIYTYLNAINNSTVESYGIPSVYFYGSWRNYVLMAISLIDPTFNNNYRFYDLDILIVFKEFLRISKYIHSRGIHHNDISRANFMFRRDRGFIVDFGLASRMYSSTTLRLTPQKAYEDVIRLTRDDWTNFLFSMSEIVGIKLHWFGDPVDNDVLKQRTFRKLQSIEFEHLRYVFIGFAKQIFGMLDDAGISPYDRIYHFVESRIQIYETEPPYLVSWLSDEEKSKAKQEFKSTPIPAIEHINDPLNIVEIVYQPVNPELFDELYHREMNADALSSNEEYERHHL